MLLLTGELVNWNVDLSTILTIFNGCVKEMIMGNKFVTQVIYIVVDYQVLGHSFKV